MQSVRLDGGSGWFKWLLGALFVGRGLMWLMIRGFRFIFWWPKGFWKSETLLIWVAVEWLAVFRGLCLEKRVGKWFVVAGLVRIELHQAFKTLIPAFTAMFAGPDFAAAVGFVFCGPKLPDEHKHCH